MNNSGVITENPELNYRQWNESTVWRQRVPSGLIACIWVINFCFKKLLKCHFQSLHSDVTGMLDLHTYSHVSGCTKL